MALRRKNGKRARKSKRRVRKSRKTSGRSSSRKTFKKNLRSVAEKKHSFVASSALLIGSYLAANWSTTSLFPVTPYTSYCSITQGTAQDQRIGNKIFTQKSRLKFLFWPAGYNVTTNVVPRPVYIKIWFLAPKNDSISTPPNLANLFQLGSTSIAPAGTLSDLIHDINKDFWVVYKTKCFKLGFQTNTGSGAQNIAANYANNDFPMFKKFTIDLSKITPKTIFYNDNTSLPGSRGIYCAVEAISSDGNSPYQAVDRPVNMQYEQDFYYTDV